MIHFEREVVEVEFIEEMLKMFHHVNVGINGEDGYPYVVPLNYGFEINEDKLIVYTHFMKRGLKVDLIKKDPRVCLEFSAFNDFPDRKYKGHYHDYRSVIAKGTMKLVDGNQDYDTFKKGYDLLYVCNNREIKPLEDRPAIPPMYIGVIECDMANVTAKSEFPIRKKEDVPFVDVYSQEIDEEPFDISDIIAARKK
ncbi:pyridoxamine 5'-phosphate oxidase family protein [Thomasclavelia sp.]|uniref:pyridoxamine 5'-phosphate oxidase family protein n=1 Tax=Thomasclavelia sp. TaxID=3025757 RepID=UPI0025FD1A45|nr:pyridoxamine 5'-phosphate oxidase family protein [Thomasclavelia sp.]